MRFWGCRGSGSSSRGSNSNSGSSSIVVVVVVVVAVVITIRGSNNCRSSRCHYCFILSSCMCEVIN